MKDLDLKYAPVPGHLSMSKQNTTTRQRILYFRGQKTNNKTNGRRKELFSANI